MTKGINSSYNNITRNNKEIYHTFDALFQEDVTNFRNKKVKEILLDLLNRKIIHIGISNTQEIDDYGNVFMIDKNIIAISINSIKFNIDIKTGYTKRMHEVVRYIYMLLLRGIIIGNIKEIKKDEDLINNCIKFLTFFIYKKVGLLGLTEKEDKLIKGIIYLFFYKFILLEDIRKGLIKLEKTSDKETFAFLKENIGILDSYKHFFNIFKAFQDLRILNGRTYQQMIKIFTDSLSVYVLPPLFTNGLSGYLSSIIISNYSLEHFDTIYIDSKIQTYFEDKILEYYNNISFKS